MTLDIRYQIPIRWENASRYYVAIIQRDLFNDLVVSRYWGGKKSRLGNEKHELLSSIEEGMEKIRMFGKDRARHGYKVVTDEVMPPSFTFMSRIQDSGSR